MLHSAVVDHPLMPARPRRRQRWHSPLFLLGLCSVLALAISSLWLVRGLAIVDLGSESQMRSSGVYADWAKGEVIVLVRHAERCDRSRNPCLGDPQGITQAGSQAAAQVGDGLQRLGLDHTDILASPLVRTQQTAHFMFGKLAASEDWLQQCNKGFADTALARKAAERNLVLVTHSGCIDQLERQLDVPGGERSSAYTEALFVSVGASGKPRILGRMNAPEWRKLLARVDH